jgi:signal transduction histidine kinase
MRGTVRVPAVDAGVALLATAAVQVEIWGFWVAEEQGARPLAAVLGALMAAPLALRRTHPLASFVAVLVPYAVWVQVAVPQGSLVPFLIELLAVFSVARYVPWPTSLTCLAGSVVVEVAFVARTTGDFADYLFILAFLGGAWATGNGVRIHQTRADELFAETVRLEVEKEERARQAAEAERARIARELHDVVSHGVSVMVVQAAAAEQVLATDPAAARTSLAAIQHVGREARLELRRMLGLIRFGDDGAADAPPPGLGELEAMVDQFAAAGLAVDMRVTGTTAGLPPGVGLTVFRVVQEALTNAVKHGAGGRARLAVDRCDGELTVEVVNPTAAPPEATSGGYGLPGMRERVHLYGGELQHGWCPNGDFRVWARLPLGEPS